MTSVKAVSSFSCGGTWSKPGCQTFGWITDGCCGAGNEEKGVNNTAQHNREVRMWPAGTWQRERKRVVSSRKLWSCSISKTTCGTSTGQTGTGSSLPSTGSQKGLLTTIQLKRKPESSLPRHTVAHSNAQEGDGMSNMRHTWTNMRPLKVQEDKARISNWALIPFILLLFWLSFLLNRKYMKNKNKIIKNILLSIQMAPQWTLSKPGQPFVCVWSTFDFIHC